MGLASHATQGSDVQSLVGQVHGIETHRLGRRTALRLGRGPRGKYVDIGFLMATWGFGFLVCWEYATPFWLAEVVVFGVPLLYLVWSSPAARAGLEPAFLVKAIVFCVVFFNYVGLRYQGWTAPSLMPLVFGVPVEQALWCVLAIPLVVALHQRFFAVPLDISPRKGVRPLVYGLFAGGLTVAVLPPLRAMMDGYVYLKIGLLIYPLIGILALRLGRDAWRGILGITAVFLVLNSAFEALALHYGFWSFSGQYVGWIELLGLRLPVEEAVFIITLCAPGIVVVHALRDNWKGIIRGRDAV
jgi:hypothetical protein